MTASPTVAGFPTTAPSATSCRVGARNGFARMTAVGTLKRCQTAYVSTFPDLSATSWKLICSRHSIRHFFFPLKNGLQALYSCFVICFVSTPSHLNAISLYDWTSGRLLKGALTLKEPHVFLVHQRCNVRIPKTHPTERPSTLRAPTTRSSATSASNNSV